MPSWHFTTVDNPTPVNPNSYLRSINDSGTLLGDNRTAGGGGERAFVGIPGHFTELQAPPGGGTRPGQIADDGVSVLTGGLHSASTQPYTYDGAYHAIPVPGGVATGVDGNGAVVRS